MEPSHKMRSDHREAATAITKHSLLIAGHQTSISLEDAFWQALRRLAARRAMSIAGLVAEIDARRGEANLSSAIRVHLLEALSTAPTSTDR